MPSIRENTNEAQRIASRLPTWFRHALLRWTAPQIDPDDRMEPDMVNIMAHRPAGARVRCMLSPLSRALDREDGRVPNRG